MEKVEKIIHGDSLHVLKTLDDNSVDSVVTDPPYGLSKEPDINEVLTKWLAGEEYDHGHGGFMGKSWDSFVPHPDIWAEVYRVLKPGGHALVFAGTRTQDLMTISLRLAGFEVRDVIEWLYFSGFPKSHDVSKAFDRRRNEDLPHIYAVTKFIAEGRNKAGKTNRDIDNHFGLNGMADHWTTQASQPQVPKLNRWVELKAFLNLSDELDDEVWRLNGRKGKPGDAWDEREKVGESDNGIAGGTKEHAGISGAYGFNGSFDISAPATDLARKWDGWGTALKPAHEPIIVVRKPLIDADTGRKLTVADCVEKYGTGAINIDASRIAEEGYAEKALRKYSGTISQDSVGRGFMTSNGGKIECQNPKALEKGRFPANCITLDSDQFYSKYFNISPEELSKKASKKDRNSDWEGEEIALEEKEAGVMHGSKTAVLNDSGKTPYNRNNHPTVKPTDLMAWLVRLVTPAGGTVLDPFAGSGSTLVAAKREGFGFIGVELTEEYIPIIEARVGAKATGTKAETSEGQAKQ